MPLYPCGGVTETRPRRIPQLRQSPCEQIHRMQQDGPSKVAPRCIFRSTLRLVRLHRRRTCRCCFRHGGGVLCRRRSSVGARVWSLVRWPRLLYRHRPIQQRQQLQQHRATPLRERVTPLCVAHEASSHETRQCTSPSTSRAPRNVGGHGLRRLLRDPAPYQRRASFPLARAYSFREVAGLDCLSVPIPVPPVWLVPL